MDDRHLDRIGAIARQNDLEAAIGQPALDEKPGQQRDSAATANDSMYRLRIIGDCVFGK